MFSEKLNFLMNLTGVKNSDLALAVSMDASHISRLRNGGRRLSKNQSYVMPMARYFAKNLTEPFKRRIVADSLHFPAGWPKDERTAADLIYKWLVSEERADALRIDRFLAGYATAGRTRAVPPEPLAEKSSAELSSLCYYGVEGKQKAVLRLLNEVLKEETPQTLLLFSDEEMSWLYEDVAFAREWTRLLTAVLRNGNRIKIIHTISRDSNEMTEALIKWIPVYMTGAIEPYYYPKLRDGVFQKTLFIAPNTAAIVSSSVKQDISEMLNLYIVIPAAVRSLVLEYERYLSLCRPLIDIMNVTRAERYFKEISDFESIAAPGIVLAPVPSLMSMPKELAEAFAKRAPRMGQAFEQARRQLSLFSEENAFYEILLPPTKEQIAANAIPMPMNDFFCADTLCYTVEQYKQHLRHILRLTKEYPHYHAVVRAESVGDVMVYAKEDIGVVIAGTCAPTVVFTMREPNITSAFWSYLQALLPAAEKDSQTAQAQTIKKLLDSL